MKIRNVNIFVFFNRLMYVYNYISTTINVLIYYYSIYYAILHGDRLYRDIHQPVLSSEIIEIDLNKYSPLPVS